MSNKILILGASNEIMSDGWVSCLDGLEIKNFSVGGCSSVAGIAMIATKGFPESDFVVLNYELNEHAIIGSGVLSPLRASYYWEYLLTTCQRKGAIPIVITLPRLKDGEIYRTSTCDMHRELAARCGAIFLDFAEIIHAEFGAEERASRLFRDESHLTPAAQRIIGEAVSRIIKDIDLSSRQDNKVIRYIHTFHPFHSTDLEGLPHISKSSSFDGAEMVVCNGNTNIILEIPHGYGELVGISLNRKSKGALLTAGQHSKVLRYPQAGQDGFMRVVLDVGAWEFKAGEAAISFHSVNFGKATERTWLSGAIPNSSDCDVEIESFLFMSSASEKVEFFFQNICDNSVSSIISSAIFNMNLGLRRILDVC